MIHPRKISTNRTNETWCFEFRFDIPFQNGWYSQVPCESFGVLQAHEDTWSTHTQKISISKIGYGYETTQFVYAYALSVVHFSASVHLSKLRQKLVREAHLINWPPQFLQRKSKNLTTTCKNSGISKFMSHQSHHQQIILFLSLFNTCSFVGKNGDFLGDLTLTTSFLSPLRLPDTCGDRVWSKMLSFPWWTFLLGCNRYTHTPGPGYIQLPVKLTP